MSALPPISDINRPRAQVINVPKADSIARSVRFVSAIVPKGNGQLLASTTILHSDAETVEIALRRLS